ncbi:MAG: M23 family metallopeptidase [Moorea sp. SIO1G6]|uniref:M23 family metallopeptidase n=1 Tax=Moorena sp. SIO1G6 TaxID=2607840 RepID=UPI0013BFD5FD|nr:M23 family metallopeptidase [Moorena sp. SIO1G6]NET66800.1 M23 family metallopeptidase [Moorena sp. SIO1G6]
MNVVRWLPIISTIFWLVTPTVASSNLGTTYSYPDSLSVDDGWRWTSSRFQRTQSQLNFKHSTLQAANLNPSTLTVQTVQQAQNTVSQNTTIQDICPPPVLSRLTRHQVAAGQTVESIANQYNLEEATLLRLNPSLSRQSMPVGQEILIPPFNGILVNVPLNATWQDLADAYGVRAAVLFELNGCKKPSKQAFIPGLNSLGIGIPTATRETPTVDRYTGLTNYPLPTVARIGLDYGWRQDAGEEEKKFHAGVDLLAQEGTQVVATDSGIVAYAGPQDTYGNLVVINHEGGRQTRYAHLNRTTVSPGQKINVGQLLGTVGTTGNPDIDQAHLHFEVRLNSPGGWAAQDPKLHLKITP